MYIARVCVRVRECVGVCVRMCGHVLYVRVRACVRTRVRR